LYPCPSLCLNSLLHLIFDLLDWRLVLQGLVVQEDTGALDDTDDTEEEVDSGEPISLWLAIPSPILPPPNLSGGNSQIILRLDDQAPPRPDQSGSSQGTVLRERQLLGRAGKVRDTRQHDAPLHDGRPEVHRLEADGAVPHALEPADLRLRVGRRAALPALAARIVAERVTGEVWVPEEGARGAEDRR
jgi:hypothetical protein